MNFEDEREELKKPKLLAPAGDWTMLVTAIKNGADEVYFGTENLNMRSKAENFQLADLEKIASYCREHNVKTNLTLNSIVYEDEIDLLDTILIKAKEAGIDMVICWDFAVIQKCRELNIPFCISTQASISNSQSAKFFKEMGASRIVLARECTLDKIEEIKKEVDIEIETFIHGAMCVAISGRCFMSHDVFNKSANRGECIQPCRREYEIIDKEEGHSFILGEDYVMSPKDLCTIEFIDKLIEAKIDIFKIEGRKRSPEYIAKVVSSYRKAIDQYFDGVLTEEKKAEHLKELEKVYNRGFSSGFYFGTPGKEEFSDTYGSHASTRKVYLGKVLNYFKKESVGHARIMSGEVKKGDQLYIIGDTTGVVELELNDFYSNDKSAESAAKGEEITFKCPEIIRTNDKVYKVVEVEKNNPS